MIPDSSPTCSGPIRIWATTYPEDTGTYTSTSIGFYQAQDDCPCCRQRPANSRNPDWLCFHCAELQRWLPRKLRHDLAALRASLDEFEKVMKKARAYFHPPSWVWRGIVSEPKRPARPVSMKMKAHRQQVRLPAVRSQLALRKLRAGRIHPRSRS